MTDCRAGCGRSVCRHPAAARLAHRTELAPSAAPALDAEPGDPAQKLYGPAFSKVFNYLIPDAPLGEWDKYDELLTELESNVSIGLIDMCGHSLSMLLKKRLDASSG